MNPYRRDPTDPDSRARLADPDDERILLWIVFFVGILPPIWALVRGAVWTAEPTIGLFLCTLAGLGLVARRRSQARNARTEAPDAARANIEDRADTERLRDSS
jgi:hypothetical protein